VEDQDWPIAKASSLGGGEVHVWRFPLDVHDAQSDDLALDLSTEERDRAARFSFERDRRRYIAAHGALRRILGSYLSELPAAILIAAEPGAKPRLLAHADLRFNLAHSANLGLVAVARGREVGVDVERARDPFDGVDALAASCLSDEELVALRGLAQPDRRAAFFSTWTRKEAFLKGLGDGLARELDSFDVTVPPAAACLLRVRDDSVRAEEWTLCDLHPERGFAATVAFEGAAVIRCWTWIPEEVHGNRIARELGAVRGSGERRGAILDLARRSSPPAGLAAHWHDGITRGLPRAHREGVEGHEAGQSPFRSRKSPLGRGPEGDLG